MKRYDLYKRSISDRSSMVVRKEGLWVRYKDVREFLPDAQKTAYNKVYIKCPECGETVKINYSYEFKQHCCLICGEVGHFI